MAGAHRDNQASTGVGGRNSLPTSAHSVCADRVCQMEVCIEFTSQEGENEAVMASMVEIFILPIGASSVY